jgi:hypothetical protein
MPPTTAARQAELATPPADAEVTLRDEVVAALEKEVKRGNPQARELRAWLAEQREHQTRTRVEDLDEDVQERVLQRLLRGIAEEEAAKESIR